MTLHEAIFQILSDEGRPLSIRKIADQINKNKFYTRKDEKPIENSQIRSRVKNYSKLFDYVNGQVVLTSDTQWRELLTTYQYLSDMLRNHFSRSDLQYFLAVMLFLKRINDLRNLNDAPIYTKVKSVDGRLNEILTNFFGESEINIFKVEQNFNIDSLEFLPYILDESERLYNQLDFERSRDVLATLNKVNTIAYSDEVFGNIYDYLLHFISIEFSNSTVPYTPQYLKELMLDLLNPKENKVLYDPVCGSAGLLIEALKITNGKLIAKGTEINHRMAQLGYMNLIMNGFWQTKIVAENCMREFDNNEVFDYIIADLPMNGFSNTLENEQLFHRWALKSTRSGKGYSAPVLFVLSKLNDTGKAVITVSESLLFKGGKEKEIRELLIREDLIESIISLPNGAFKPYTEAKASLLVLNKKKPTELRGKIKFIETQKTFSDSKTIDIDSDNVILSHDNIQKKRNHNLRIISSDHLRNDMNLSVATYSDESIEAEEMLANESGRKLGELVEIRSGKSPRLQQVGTRILEKGLPVIKIENLSKDIMDMYLDVKLVKLQIDPLIEYHRSILSTEGILVARIGDNLKPTYYKPKNGYSEILFHSSIIALVPKVQTDLIDLEYLYYQLNSDFVNNQIIKNRAGSVMPHITIGRLKEIVIPYVSIELQKQFTNTQKANIIAAERSKVEGKIRALGYEEEIEQKESDIVRTLVHQLRPTLTNIDFQVRGFKRIIEKFDLGEKKEYEIQAVENPLVDTPENLTLIEKINKLQAESINLNNVLTTVNQVMNFKLETEDMVETNLHQFIEDYKNDKRPDKYNIDVAGTEITTNIHQPAFKELLDQLISNAENHGFKDQKIPKEGFKVQFRIRQSKERPIAIIDYTNNGKRFLLTQKDYINLLVKGQSSGGSGIGGNYIYRIVKAHGGDLQIKENTTSGFSMSIEIPLNLTEDDQ